MKKIIGLAFLFNFTFFVWSMGQTIRLSDLLTFYKNKGNRETVEDKLLEFGFSRDKPNILSSRDKNRGDWYIRYPFNLIYTENMIVDYYSDINGVSYRFSSNKKYIELKSQCKVLGFQKTTKYPNITGLYWLNSGASIYCYATKSTSVTFIVIPDALYEYEVIITKPGKDMFTAIESMLDKN